MNPNTAGRRLAQVLGIIAGLLAWTAALIRYLKDGEVALSLIAAGVFIMAVGFMARPSPPEGNS